MSVTVGNIFRLGNIIHYFIMLHNISAIIVLSTYTPVPQSLWLILHSSEARFISSGHQRKTIVSQSDESDLCLSTIRSVSDVSGVHSSSVIGDIFASSDRTLSDTIRH